MIRAIRSIARPLLASCLSLCSLVCLATTAHAQIEPGDWRISAGVLTFSYTDSEIDADDVGVDVDLEQTQLAITPGAAVRLGYATSETMEIGLDLAVNYVDLEVEDEDTDAWELAVGPYAGLNLPVNPGGDLLMGPWLSLRYARLDSDEFESNTFQLVAGGEAKFFVAEKASLDVGIFFAYENGDGEFDVGDTDVDIESFSFGPRISISIWP